MGLWILQIFLIAAGIHLFLHFVRTTRGNPLIRGLFMTVVLGLAGLWGLSTALQLEELQHILQGSLGYIMILLAMVFQPELRRGIAQLGERTFAPRRGQQSNDALRRIVQASQAMATRRDGALICFERQSSLRTVIETGSSIGSRVNARLLESIFHPGAALHDGAVVISENKVLAAGCYLPLSRENALDLSLGTRHRAALGLTEETDAVVLVVSEETGHISIASGGYLQEHVPPDEVEDQLRVHLKSHAGSSGSGRQGFLKLMLLGLRKDFLWVLGSLLLATCAFLAAHATLEQTQSFTVSLVDATTTEDLTPGEGEILIVSPDPNTRVRSDDGQANHRITVSGTSKQLQELGASLSGRWEVSDPNWNGGPLDLNKIHWERKPFGLVFAWENELPPNLIVEHWVQRRVALTPLDIPIDASKVDVHYEMQREGISFDPTPSIELRGPQTVIEELLDTGAGSLQLKFEEIVLLKDDLPALVQPLRLHPDLRAKGLSIEENQGVKVSIPVLPVQRELAQPVRKDIALLCMEPARAELLNRWSLPANAQTARYTILTSGLLPLKADPNSAAYKERTSAITKFVEENLFVFVDVAQLPPRDAGRQVPVRISWRKNWWESPELFGLTGDTITGHEKLEVRLESAKELLLEPRLETEDQ